MYRYESLLNKLSADLSSGSYDIAHLASLILFNYAEERADLHSVDFRANLLILLKKLTKIQPDMALMFNLIVGTLKSIDCDKPHEELRKFVEEFSEEIVQSPVLVARQMRKLIPSGSTVGTISYSKAARKCLELAADKINRVIISESQPGGEGVKLANDLRDTIKEVVLIPDAGWGQQIRHCDIVLIGVDAITEEGVVNKIGSLLLALLSKKFEIPFLVAGSKLKLIPKAVIAKTPTKIFPNEKLNFIPQDNVKIDYPIFESVPFNLITYIVTESGETIPEQMTKKIDNLRKTYNLLNII